MEQFSTTRPNSTPPRSLLNNSSSSSSSSPNTQLLKSLCSLIHGDPKMELFILFLILINLHSLSFFFLVEAQNNSWCFEHVGNYTENSIFQRNLYSILHTSSSSMPETGFYMATTGDPPNRVTISALCRVDIQFSDCLSCIRSAAREIVAGCPYRRQATQYKENCTLRYSNRSLVGVFSASEVQVIIVRALNQPPNIQQFNSVLFGLTARLRDIAATAGPVVKVAAGNTAGPDFVTIYALLQCSPDLTTDDCDGCLSVAMGFIPDFNGSTGAAILPPICRLNYDTRPFFNSTRIEEVQALVLESRTPAIPPSSPDFPRSPPRLPEVPLSPPRLPEVPLKRATKLTGNSQIIIIIISMSIIGGVVAFLVIGAICVRRKCKISKKATKDDEAAFTVESLQYDFDEIRIATHNFSLENKLGRGGFGVVYKGKLENGREIAVKRLSEGSSQGDMEFKNEVMLLANLQHRHLVKLYGFAIQGGERLLIYEFMKNGSLYQFIFDPVKRSKINWDRRFKIIEAIAKGLLYMHEHSRYRIIHRDLKPSNILLDGDMNPKIADFGLARLFVFEETHESTSIIMGTPAYMAPEYRQGEISMKTDVFSFGVLLLEIVSGQRNSSFTFQEMQESMLSFAWRSWEQEKMERMIDPISRESSGSLKDMLKCIHIGLLCVHKNAVDRPTMSSIVHMLNSSTLTMPLPSQPAYFVPDSSDSRHDEQVLKNEPSVNDISKSELHPR